jgi:hypothetical protein
MLAVSLVSTPAQDAPPPVPARPLLSPPGANPLVPPPAPAPGDYTSRLQEIMKRSTGVSSPPASLTKFDLDFPGGTPGQLVGAVEKAMGKPLNAIILSEDANVQLPPLKMNNVDVAQLFQALQSASMKREAYVSSTYYGGLGGPSSSYQVMVTSYGFKTSGTPTDDSVWYFYTERPAFPPLVQAKSCRFYLLAPYLDRGLTVDDITTAIQTGWKMLGDASPPKISFHKETKLLIAVGEPSKLEIIDAVLKALEAPRPGHIPAIDPNTGLPVPPARPKAKN